MKMNEDVQVMRALRIFLSRRAVRSALGVMVTFLGFAIDSYGVGPYVVEKNTVLDQGTGLEWQKSDTGTVSNWQDSLAYCEKLSLDSKTDWRLPNIRELKSIVDLGRYYPAIDPAFICRSAYYWSSDTVADHPTTSAWNVFFANGDDNWHPKSTNYYARCVRGGL
jgi:hypothetical protein